MACLLTKLTKKVLFVWNDRAEQDFLRLKRAVTSALVLHMTNFQLLFTVETDTSDMGVGKC